MYKEMLFLHSPFSPVPSKDGLLYVSTPMIKIG